MRIAVIADIHGNHLALAEVLEELGQVKPDVIIQLGDAFNGPIDPSAVVHMLRAVDAYHIQGNGERMILQQEAMGISKSARFARDRLSLTELQWIAGWPTGCFGDEWQAFHGSPNNDTEYLLEQVSAGGVRLRDSKSICDCLGETKGELLFCGHTHIPRVVALPDGRIIVNPGSVGLPAYEDDTPFPHKMETGSPHARFAVVEKIAGRWSASLRSVPYDWQRAALVADENGFDGWGRILRSGYV